MKKHEIVMIVIMYVVITASSIIHFAFRDRVVVLRDNGQTFEKYLDDAFKRLHNLDKIMLKGVKANDIRLDEQEERIEQLEKALNSSGFVTKK